MKLICVLQIDLAQYTGTLKFLYSPTLRCVLQLRISCPQWVVFNGVKGQTSVIVQSDPSISIKGSLLLGER